MDQPGPLGAIRAAAVVRPGERQAEVRTARGNEVVEYGRPFGSRASSLTPGHLVAVAPGPRDVPLILWRWYDAVIVGQVGEEVVLWEPGHGEVLAQPRDLQQEYVVGTRAYTSAGLPGAEWWVEGPVAPVEHAAVSLDAVNRFYTENGLWALLG